MRWQIVGCGVVLSWVAVLGMATPARAQVGMAPAGIVVDAEGVLRKQIVNDPDGRLTQERAAAARAALAPDIIGVSALRKISLTRLEKLLRERQGAPTEAMRYLAGLQRVRYVFFYPESKDIVIAGPAQGWMTDLTGRVVGIVNGRPTLQLQDLVVALRAFPPSGGETPVIGCSIDPTQEGLAAMQRFLQSIGVTAVPSQTQFIVDGLQNSLGNQDVTIEGVSAQTHFAHVMVEADYRMKLIGIGLEQPPVRLASYVDRANPSQVSRNAMQRWFFTPEYNCVRASDDGLAMELVGDGVKLVGEDEMVTGDGMRRKAARGNRASETFVAAFTKKYSELADRSPVFAELRNLIDLTVAAAYMQQEDYYAKADWDLGIFAKEETFAVETYQTPKKVATAVTAVWKGNQLMTPVGGGVRIEATQALDSQNMLVDEKAKVSELRNKVKLNLAEGQWWWD